MSLPDVRTRYLFFTGKGGVGKTSLSCATGLARAEAGKSVLIVSTDPASNLDEVLGVPLGQAPTAIPGAAGLCALNIDPEAAAQAYRERMVGPYRGILPAAAIRSMEEQFSGACTVEIAAFDEFSKLLGEPAATAEFDHVIFDTAPTGHTLRLLTLPSAWNEFIASSTGGASCLGPLAGLEKQKALYAATVARLADPAETAVILVSRPEAASLREAERTRGELAELGVRNLQLAINGVFATERQDDAIAVAMSRRAAEALARMPETLAQLPGTTIPFLPRGTVALALAKRGGKVTLYTTDPAAHLALTLDGEVPGVTVTRIDPATEVAHYTREVLGKAGKSLDAGGLAMLEEDLRSPCTEEIAVFRAFARTVAEGRDGFVVLDTAPTGHTILLLDAAEAYHREVMRTQGDMPEAVRQLLPRLRDPDFTKVLIVTLAEATPVHEAERLQADLARAGIEPFAWVINQSLLASGTHDPLLAQRGGYEVPFIRRVKGTLSTRCVLIPWLTDAPVGERGLREVVLGSVGGTDSGGCVETMWLALEVGRFPPVEERAPCQSHQSLDMQEFSSFAAGMSYIARRN